MSNVTGNDMDDLFKRAASGYPLRTNSSDWNRLVADLEKDPSMILPPLNPEEGKRKRRRFLWLFLLLPLGGLGYLAWHHTGAAGKATSAATAKSATSVSAAPAGDANQSVPADQAVSGKTSVPSNTSVAANSTVAANPSVSANPSTSANSSVTTNPSISTNPSVSANPSATTNPPAGVNSSGTANRSGSATSAASANPSVAVNPSGTVNPSVAVNPSATAHPPAGVNSSGTANRSGSATSSISANSSVSKNKSVLSKPSASAAKVDPNAKGSSSVPANSSATANSSVPANSSVSNSPSISPNSSVSTGTSASRKSTRSSGRFGSNRSGNPTSKSTESGFGTTNANSVVSASNPAGVSKTSGASNQASGSSNTSGASNPVSGSPTNVDPRLSTVSLKPSPWDRRYSVNFAVGAPKTSSQPESSKSNPRNKEKKIVSLDQRPHYFYVGLTAAPDFSTIKWQSVKGTGTTFSFILGYHFSSRWAIETGISLDRKKYYSSGDYYKKDKYEYLKYIDNLKVQGVCNMWEIPINVRYDFSETPKSKWFATTGLSSYLMTGENYDFWGTHNGGMPWWASKDYNQASHYWFSIVNLSLGYERKLGKVGNLRLEPYLKIPLAGVGSGSLPIMSAGLNIGITRRIW